METSERDLLIQIDTKLSQHIENYRRTRDEDLIKISESNQRSVKAHERIDRVIVVGGITVFLTVSGLILTVVLSYGGKI